MILADYQKTIIFNYLAIGSNVLIGFILFPLIINHLDMVALSIFGIFYSIKSVIDIGIGWLSGSITKNLIKYKYLKNSIITLSFIINTLYGLIGLVVFILYGYFVKPNFFISSIFFSFFVFFSFAITPYYEILISELKQSIVALSKFISNLLFLVLSIGVFFLYEQKNLDLIFGILACSSLVVYLFMYVFIKRNTHFKVDLLHINKKLLHKLFYTDGLKIFLNAVSLILLLQIDVLLIDYLYGSIAVANYLILWKIPNTIIMLGWRLSEPYQAIVPREIQKDKNQAKSNFLIFERKILIISLLASVLYVIFGNYILGLWIGVEKIPNISYMYIIPSLLIGLSIIQRLYISTNFYTIGLENVNKFQFIELGIKILSTVFLYSFIHEVSPLFGWLVGLSILIILYRKNALKVFDDK